MKVPEGVTAAQASACTDALLTPYHGVNTISNLQPEENVVVVGLGGVGLNAFKIAKLFGAKVFATDLKVRTPSHSSSFRRTSRLLRLFLQPSALEAALAAGATAALPSGDLEHLLSAPDSPPIALVIDCVGSASTFSLAQRLVAPGGRVLLGLHDPALQWDVARNIEREVALLMSFWGTRKELGEVMELVAEGKLDPTVEEKGMGEVPWAVGEMEAGRVTGRLAFVPEKE